MNELEIILLTGFVTVLSSIITAFITLSLTHKNEVKKFVLEKRAELYSELYSFIEILLFDELKIYDCDYIEDLLRFKPKMKFIASVETIKEFRLLYELIIAYYDKYRDFSIQNSPYNNPGAIKIMNYNDEEYEIDNVTAIDMSNHKDNIERFKMDNLPDKEIISASITALYTNMRNDLGSNIE